MKRRNFVVIAAIAVLLTMLASCGKQEEAKVKKVAGEVKAKVEAEAKELEALNRVSVPGMVHRVNFIARWVCLVQLLICSSDRIVPDGSRTGIHLP